jgi:hypothetical protein
MIFFWNALWQICFCNYLMLYFRQVTLELCLEVLSSSFISVQWDDCNVSTCSAFMLIIIFFSWGWRCAGKVFRSGLVVHVRLIILLVGLKFMPVKNGFISLVIYWLSFLYGLFPLAYGLICCGISCGLIWSSRRS